MPSPRPIRLAARAVIVQDGRLLLVNAFKGNDRLWCAPGGGAEPHASLPENLAREVWEETGLTVEVGAPCLVSEFHDIGSGFHQVEVFFRCTITAGTLSDDWQDSEAVVSHRRFFSPAEMIGLAVKPDSLPAVAFDGRSIRYDPLEPIFKLS